jgi:hypothetical protein
MSVNPLPKAAYFLLSVPRMMPVLALTVQFKLSILQVGEFGFIDGRCGQRRGNKDNPILLPGPGPRQYYGSPDTTER